MVLLLGFQSALRSPPLFSDVRVTGARWILYSVVCVHRRRSRSGWSSFGRTTFLAVYIIVKYCARAYYSPWAGPLQKSFLCLWCYMCFCYAAVPVIWPPNFGVLMALICRIQLSKAVHWPCCACTVWVHHTSISTSTASLCIILKEEHLQSISMWQTISDTFA